MSQTSAPRQFSRHCGNRCGSNSITSFPPCARSPVKTEVQSARNRRLAIGANLANRSSPRDAPVRLLQRLEADVAECNSTGMGLQADETRCIWRAWQPTACVRVVEKANLVAIQHHGVGLPLYLNLVFVPLADRTCWFL